MKKLALTAGLVLAASVALAPLAFAQDATTGGVSQADGNKVCAAVAGKPAPAEEAEAAFRAAYNTVDNTDDGPASAGVSPEWQALIYQQELHRDYLGGSGLNDAKTFTCSGKTADFPDLVMADEVATAVCGNARIDVIANPALRARVAAALKALDRTYANARSDCPAPPTSTPPPATTTVTPAPTTTVTVPPTTTVAPPVGPVYPTCADAVAAGAAPIAAGGPGYRPELDSDNDGVACDLAPDTDPGVSGFSQVGVVPQGGVDTGTR